MVFSLKNNFLNTKIKRGFPKEVKLCHTMISRFVDTYVQPFGLRWKSFFLVNQVEH